jgi:hypothetical protein
MPLENINDPELKKELEPIFDRGRQAAGGAINHVGLLYAKIFWLFQADDSPNPYWPGMPADLLPNEWHITDKQLAKGILDQRQVTAAEFGRVPVSLVHPAADAVYVVEIRSRNDALFALAQIARQGEGYQPGDNSHFERFLKAYKDFAAILPSGVIPVPENPTTDDTALPPPAEANRITHPKACRWAKLFDVRYQLLLLELWLGVSTDRTEPGPFARGKLLKAALIEMKTRIRQIGGKLLPSLDRKDVDPKNLKAGAPFFLPDKSLPRTQKAVQARMKKLLSDAEALAVAIENLPDLNAPSADESLILKTMRRADKPFNDALAGL